MDNGANKLHWNALPVQARIFCALPVTHGESRVPHKHFLSVFVPARLIWVN
jgi:hypothetical protein